MITSPFPHLCLLAVALFALNGCSPADPVGKRVHVEGVVSVDGMPLTRGTMSFRADESKGNSQKHEPYAAIGPDGRYKVITMGKDGCAPGWYKVLIESKEPPREDGVMGPLKTYVDPKYSDPRDPLIDVEVVENPISGQYDIKITK